MSKLDSCIARTLAAGRISPDQAEQIQALRERVAAGRTGDFDARTLEQYARELETNERNTILQLTKQAEALERATAHSNGVSTGVMSILGRDITGRSRGTNIDARKHAIMQQVQGMMAEVMQSLRPITLGLRQNTQVARTIVRELFGETSGDIQAARFAKRVGEVFEYMRQRFNRAGGAIQKRADFGLPQMHHAPSVAKVGKKQWIATVRPLLDPSRMYDDVGQPLTSAELDRRLPEIYADIIAEVPRRRPLGQFGRRSTAATRQDRRQLAFRNGEAWLEYFDQFGGRDVYAHIMDHLESMASDIALMEVLGPNPEATFRYLRDLAKRDGAKGFTLGQLDALWRVISGRTDDTSSLRFADTMTAIRNYLTSAKLGSALLSSVSDLAFIRQTAAWNGLSSARIMRQALSILHPANEADRLRATRMGLIADAWTSRALAANRFTEVTGAGLSARLADFTMRASGLSAWTDAAQKAVGMELMGVLADNRALRLSEIDPDFRQLLEAAGFDDADWDILRSTDTDTHKGVEQVYMPNLAARKDLSREDRERVIAKLLEMTFELTNQAIPTPDARVRALTTGGYQRGTIKGEAARVASQFKSFPVSVVLQHVYRGIYQSAGVDKASYLASLTIATTVMGAMAIQLKELSKGRTPRRMDDGEFWAAAFTQGGGAGIFGDFFAAGVMGSNRHGGSLAETLGGPIAGLATDVARTTAGQLGEAIEGEDANLGRDLTYMMSRYTPGVGSLWYTRLAYERAVIDQLALELDPKAPARFRRERRRLQKERDQRFWWARGELQPERNR
ncbi:MAG: hypothetical protein AAFV47_09210 [Pseudomonadota bacterium]